MNELHLQVTPVRTFDVPEVFEVQVAPSEDVSMFPESPTAKKIPFSKATARRTFEVPEVIEVQEIASDEVLILPRLEDVIPTCT